MKPTSSNRSGETTHPDAKVQPAAGKGMPARSPQPQRARSDQPTSPKDGSVESSLELPHERDQATDMTQGKTSPVIEQAGRDEANGLKDTSKAVELDRTYKRL